MLKKSIVAALCMMILAPMAMGQVLVNYQIQMVDEFLRPKSFDGSLSIYIYRPGTTDQISVYKPYSYRSFLCAQPITTTSVNSPIYGSANSLIFATAWTSVDLVITDGTFDRTLYSCAPDRTYRLMWPSFGRDWLENTQLSDTAGDGDTTKIWSADKVFDELSGKQDLNARLTAVSVLSPNADEGMYWSGPTQLSLFSFTSFARDLMADPNGDAMLGTIDPNLQSFVRVLDANETVVTITSDVNVVGGLASSTLSIDGNDITYVATTPWWVTRLESDANEADFKAGVNLEIGTDVQAYDADLTTWAGITPHASWQDILDGTVTTGSNRTAINTELGLGTGDSPQFTAVNIGHATDTTVARSGAGDLTVEGNAIYRAGGTDVPVADGGTGASTLTDGGVLLGSGTGAITPMAVLAANQIIVGDGTTDPTVLTVDANEIALWDGAETDTERRTWKGDHNLDHAYDVRDYGATGDGATDDAAAIQAAYNAAKLVGAWTYLPAGTYLISSAIDVDNYGKFRGDAGKSIILQATAATPLFQNSPAANVEQLIFEGLVFDADAAGCVGWSNPGYYTSYAEFRDCQFTLDLSVNVQTVSGNFRMYNCIDGKTGSLRTSHQALDLDGTDTKVSFSVLIEGCYFWNSEGGDACIEVDNGNTLLLVNTTFQNLQVPALYLRGVTSAYALACNFEDVDASADSHNDLIILAKNTEDSVGSTLTMQSCQVQNNAGSFDGGTDWEAIAYVGSACFFSCYDLEGNLDGYYTESSTGYDDKFLTIARCTPSNYLGSLTGAGLEVGIYKITANAGLVSKNGSTSAGYIDIYEDSDAGTSKIRLIGPALAGDVTLTLPATDGDPNQYVYTDGSGTLGFRHFIEDVNNVSADITNFDTHGLHIINSSGGAITGALADGTVLGQRVKFVCKVAGNDIDISVSHHATSDPEVIRLDTAKEWVTLVWDGTDWTEVDGSGQTYP